MIDRKHVRQTVKAFRRGADTMIHFLEAEGPKLLRRAGETLHVVKPRPRLAPLGVALGLLGAVAVLGLVAGSGVHD